MKNYFYIGALLFLGFKLFNKKKQIEALKEFLEVRPSNIRNIRLVNNGVKMTMDINLINTGDRAFSLSGLGLIKLKKLNFFTTQGAQLATAYPEISNIEIEPKGTTVIKNVEVIADFINVGQNLLQILYGAELHTTAEIEILGYTYTI